MASRVTPAAIGRERGSGPFSLRTVPTSCTSSTRHEHAGIDKRTTRERWDVNNIERVKPVFVDCHQPRGVSLLKLHRLKIGRGKANRGERRNNISKAASCRNPTRKRATGRAMATLSVIVPYSRLHYFIPGCNVATAYKIFRENMQNVPCNNIP